jgi:cytochrome bd-type quinol oxidase subunit 2
MTATLLFKTVIIILFTCIFISLAGGLFFLAKDKGQSRRTIYSLTTRVVLSVSLFVLLLVGYAAGLIQPHGIMPTQAPATQQIQPD